MTMTRRLILLAVTAIALTIPDLAQKAVVPQYGHPRSFLYIAVATFVLGAICAFVPRVPSATLAVGGGVAAAGAAGNLVGAVLWRDGIPNPLVAGDIAFNLADVYAVAGAAALVVGAASFALRNRHRLHEPI